ncbi:MAG: hypothetical protein IT494_07020 [Gammaproteobacteria bacterium]|nr:hypothetical protein [Gammaproteobacteria bacterium]
MNRNQVIALSLIATVLSGCAGMRTTVSAQPEVAAAEAGKNVRTPAVPERNRMLGTASVITVYTREDLQGTGEMDPARALRQLDPRFY